MRLRTPAHAFTAAIVVILLPAAAVAAPVRPVGNGAPPPPSTDQGTGIGIRAAASLPEFLPVANAIIGATGDVAGELALLAAMPSGIASPAGSSIHRFTVDYDGLAERFVASAAFTSQATAEDAVVFYQATLTAAGFRPVADSGEPDGGQSTRNLRFENPRSRLADGAVEVTVTDAAEIELTVTDAIDRDVLNAFTGWAAGLPTLAEAQAIEAAIAVATGPEPDELTLDVSTRFGYLGRTPSELAAELRRLLPDGGFSIDEEADDGSGTTLALRHVAIDELRCEISAGDVHPATLLLSGRVRL